MWGTQTGETGITILTTPFKGHVVMLAHSNLLLLAKNLEFLLHPCFGVGYPSADVCFKKLRANILSSERPRKLPS